MGCSIHGHLDVLQALALCSFITVCILATRTMAAAAAALAPDVVTLLAVKEALDSPTQPVLRSWNTTTPLCAWKGVTWSHDASFPFDCQEESYTLTFTYATNVEAVATSVILSSAGLTGTLSPAIAKLYELKELALSNNKLTGPIPEELGNSPSLSVVSLEHNSLTGAIPTSVWNLCRGSKLNTLLLHNNNFTGSIPEPLGGPGTTCSVLTSLTLGRNSLSGIIPPFIANFVNLSWLDLSYNKLTYVIPMEFANLTNLSTSIDRGLTVAGNRLMGPIPLFKQRFNPRVFEGNSPWLCGPPLLTSCFPMTVTTHKRHRYVMTLTAVTLLVTAVAVCILLVIYAISQLTTLSSYTLLLKKATLLKPAGNDDAKFPQGKLVQFYEGAGGVLTEDIMLKSARELLEETSYGQRYRAWLPSNKHMLSLCLFKEDFAKEEPEFLQGVLRLAVVKHPSLVSLRAYYLSRKDEKLLIYDHVVGESLADVIHGECTLNWPQRHKLALGIANGVAHLHREPLVHANLNSSTILVDEHRNALLTAYGLHLLATPGAKISIDVDAADEGYKAPELKKSMKLSSQVDVFSYGIVLLEILTGQKPGKVFNDHTILALQELVKAAVLGERLYDLLDHELLKPSLCMPAENGLLEVLKLAMGCCSTSPALRPTMAEVVHKLEDIQSNFLVPRHHPGHEVTMRTTDFLI